MFMISCINGESKNAELAFDYIKGLKNYISEIDITFRNELGEEKVYLKQYGKYNGHYRIDLNGNYNYVYKDNKIYVKDIKHDSINYFIDDSFDEIYKYCFLNEYIKLIYSMDQVEYFEILDDEMENKIKYFGAKINLPSNNLNINYSKIYLNSEDYLPSKLEIFDNNNNLRILIEYYNFNIVDKLDDELFNLNNLGE